MTRSAAHAQGGRRRLRRRAFEQPLTALDDRALLALLLMRAAPRADVDRIAGDLLERFDGLASVFGAGSAELSRTAAAGPAVQLDLRLVRELTVRLSRSEVALRPVISSWTSLLAYVRVALAHEPREQFRVLFLDKRNQLLRDEWRADGTVDHAPVYPREMVRRALELSASAIILVHNHPSGDPTPSTVDIQTTKQVVAAAAALGIQVHDHLVIGREGVSSFKTLGLL